MKISVPGDYCSDTKILLIKELSFKDLLEFCDKEFMIYDDNDIWENYEKHGPVFEALDEHGDIRVVWINRPKYKATECK
jgi:hypothetical protein|tara:strand:+ start:779 stop:1015 length:237 start_codon:yes stop_codon:yes gene_type:complete